MQSLLILGRQPAIGLAELESLYGAAKVKPIGNEAALVDVDPCLLAFDRLGGSIKFCKLLTELETVDLAGIEHFLINTAPKQSLNMPKGKMLLGLSAYGFNTTAKQLLKTAVNIKQAVRTTGRGVRVVPNKETALSSAQIIHNRLLTPNGWDLVLVKDGQRTLIAQTIKVQDIEAYARRDQNRPYRDAKVGMLPPKLAQTIINLSVGLLPEEAAQSVCDIPPDQPIPKQHYQNTLILDPFCGSGVILQEAAIMGYDVMGTDIDQRMVDYAAKNIDWLKSLKSTPVNSEVSIDTKLADATSYNWERTPTNIATETYLGKPLPSLPQPKDLEPVMAECNQIINDFLTNLAKQINTGARICMAVPAWQQKNKSFIHLPVLDSIGVIGYNRVSFEHVRDDQLIYYRPGQVVARELLVLTRK